MADFKMAGLEDFMRQLNELGGNVEEIAKKAVNEAAPTMESSISSSAAQSANRGYSTGALAKSVKAGKAKINNYGVYAAVTIKGSDSNGTRNGEKAAYMEYGTSKQTASPFMRRGVKNAESACRAAMEQVFETEVNKYTE